MTIRKAAVAILGMALATLTVLLYLYVWPGPCKYQYFVNNSDNGHDVYRIERATGDVEECTDGKWEKVFFSDPNITFGR